MNCRICDSDVQLYQCSKCDVYFCVDHRLPEDHGCPPVISDDPPDPHPHDVKAKKEAELIEQIQDDDWYYFADPPKWVVEAAEDDRITDAPPGKYQSKVYYGDTYVYKVVSMLHGQSVHVFTRMKK
jgi:hypothetical protein